MRRKGWIMVLCMLAVLLMVPCMKTEAASAKAKALKAYGDFVSKDTIAWDPNYKIPAANCSFSVVYIDNDKVPELVLNSSSVPHVAGFGRIFTFKNGKVKRVGKVDIDGSKFYYYKKKGVIISNYVMGGSFDNYRKIVKGKIVHKLQKGKEIRDNNRTRYYNADRKEISKSKFNRELKKLVGSKRKTSARFYKNTLSNRKNHCR